MSQAFVCGNGESRKGINLDHLKNYGKVFACNAVYRHYKPDYLIAVDVKMILEINQHKWQYDNEVWTNPNKAYNGMVNLNFFNPSKGWSSGPTALWMASEKGFDTIYMLGMDFRGRVDDKGQYSKVNNIFRDTQNYKKSHDPATYFGNWERQTLTTIRNNPNKRYIRVIEDDDNFIPKHLKDLSNLEHMKKSDFKEKFEIFRASPQNTSF